MRVSRLLSFAALACVAICALSVFATAQSDEAIATSFLGPQWKQLSRRAGMVFAGTVLSAGPGKSTPVAARSDGKGMARAVPVMELTFRVDRPIVGVELGQVLTIHEWTGAWSLQRPMRRGEHILIFLYAPSRLGLTSPVGGWRGQIELDASGQNPLEPKPEPAALPDGNDQAPVLAHAAPPTVSKTASASIYVIQLERAIRAARGE